MRLNLNPEVERYALFEAEDGDVAIWARPALTEVVEEATADASLLDYGAEVRGLLQAQEEGAELSPEVLSIHSRFGVLLAKAIARLTIERWEGVEDPDGSPAPVTPDRVNSFLDHPTVFRRWQEAYMARWFAVQSEKKGSAPSPTGTSEGAPTTATRARKSAKNAPAGSTGRKA